jgi:hypothetical protein
VFIIRVAIRAGDLIAEQAPTVRVMPSFEVGKVPWISFPCDWLFLERRVRSSQHNAQFWLSSEGWARGASPSRSEDQTSYGTWDFPRGKTLRKRSPWRTFKAINVLSISRRKQSSRWLTAQVDELAVALLPLTQRPHHMRKSDASPIKRRCTLVRRQPPPWEAGGSRGKPKPDAHLRRPGPALSPGGRRSAPTSSTPWSRRP